MCVGKLSPGPEGSFGSACFCPTHISHELTPSRTTSPAFRADEDTTKVIPCWDAAASSRHLEMVGSSPRGSVISTKSLILLSLPVQAGVKPQLLEAGAGGSVPCFVLPSLCLQHHRAGARSHTQLPSPAEGRSTRRGNRG